MSGVGHLMPAKGQEKAVDEVNSNGIVHSLDDWEVSARKEFRHQQQADKSAGRGDWASVFCHRLSATGESGIAGRHLRSSVGPLKRSKQS